MGNAAGDVKYWIAIDGASAQKYYENTILAAFERDHPRVHLNVTYQASAQQDRLVRTALQGGQGPDIVPTPGPSFALEYIDANLVADLDTYAQQHDWKTKIVGWALDSCRREGKLYSVPNQIETMLLYYNRTLFEHRNLPVPTSRAELESLCEHLAGSGIVPFAAGIGDYPPALQWFTTVFWNHYCGPEAVYQALTGQTRWTDPIFVEATTLLNTYIQKGWFGGSREKFFSNSFDDVRGSLGAGKAAMDLEGSWLLYLIDNYFGKSANNDNDWDWAPIPPLHSHVPNNVFSLAVGETLSINRRAKNPDGALTYIDWLFSNKSRAAKWMSDFPDIFEIAISLKRSDLPKKVDHRVSDIILMLAGDPQTPASLGYTTWTFWPPKSNVFLYEGMSKVLTGALTPAQYCAQLDDTFQKERKAGQVPATPRPGAL